MNDLIQQLKTKFNNFDPLEKLITINVVCYVLSLLFSLALPLFNVSFASILTWFELSSNVTTLLLRPWTLLTYSLFHGGFIHLFWNMLILHFSGRLFLNVFPVVTTFFNVYLMGVIFGGLFFLFSYSVLLSSDYGNASMIGASAGVAAIFIFVCAYTPDYLVNIFFINVKLKYLGLLFVLLDLLQMSYGNTGGHLAHLGGSALGFIYATQLKKGRDIGKGFESFFRSLFSLTKKSSNYTKVRTKPASKNNGEYHGKFNATKKQDNNQKKIDTILDKISRSGYESLTKEEKEFLFKAGKDGEE